MKNQYFSHKIEKMKFSDELIHPPAFKQKVPTFLCLKRVVYLKVAFYRGKIILKLTEKQNEKPCLHAHKETTTKHLRRSNPSLGK